MVKSKKGKVKDIIEKNVETGIYYEREEDIITNSSDLESEMDKTSHKLELR